MNPYIRALIDSGAEIYEVGGPVRDRLLGEPQKDHDYLVRHLDVSKIKKILQPLGKVTLVGKSFGVVKFTPFSEKETMIDFALPRREKSTGSGHRDFDVDFDPELSVEEDLGRRDFTINAMAMEVISGRIIDPFGGEKDLKKKILRQVFPKAFEEDPLRLMRAVQFAARFDLAIEEETMRSMKENADLIKTVSNERIAEEIRKLLIAKKPSHGFILMKDLGILPHVLPELKALVGIEQDKQPGEDVFDHTMRVLDAARKDSAIDNAGDINLMLAALLHDIGKAKTFKYHEPSKRVVFFSHQIVSRKLADRWLTKMKMSTVGVDKEKILKLIDNHMFETKAFFTDKAIRRFVSKVGPDLIFLLLDLRLADNRGGKHPSGIKGALKLKQRIKEELDRKPPFGPKDLTINGNDLIDMGIKEGPAVGLILSAIVDLVIDNPDLNTREQLLALSQNMRENVSKGSVERTRERAQRGADEQRK